MAVNDRFPSKSALRDQRRRESEAKHAEERERFEALDREQNWLRESLLKDVRSLSDTDETVMKIAAALVYLLERADD